MPARLLPLEPVAVYSHVRARVGLSAPLDGQLVSGRSNGARERAGLKWRRLLALWRDCRHARTRAMVPEDHRVRRRAPLRSRHAAEVAREGANDAAELDWAFGRRAR